MSYVSAKPPDTQGMKCPNGLKLTLLAAWFTHSAQLISVVSDNFRGTACPTAALLLPVPAQVTHTAETRRAAVPSPCLQCLHIYLSFLLAFRLPRQLAYKKALTLSSWQQRREPGILIEVTELVAHLSGTVVCESGASDKAYFSKTMSSDVKITSEKCVTR
ncbi:hypothetical protein J6590_050776 [Homalodisca vitripennis]|nr:hypothetical protein J6590_050776 [Homalodisca vitripennis]